jgi:hypothetical protein
MAKILKIEDEQILDENGKKIQRFIFNDDKIIKVDAENGTVYTSSAPDEYLDLISAYNSGANNRTAGKKSTGKDLQEKIEIIKSGKGAGLYGLLGFLCAITIIGGTIAYIMSFQFLDDISDKDYLLETDAKEINRKKGFFAWACYGNIIVGLTAVRQWKADMISVLEDKPTKASLNKHIYFKIWWPTILAVGIFRSIARS